MVTGQPREPRRAGMPSC